MLQEDFPFKFILAAAGSDETRRAIVVTLFATPLCCLESKCCFRLRMLFVGPNAVDELMVCCFLVSRAVVGPEREDLQYAR